MKAIISALEKLQSLLEEEISKRETYYDDKYDKWQDSDTGIEYQEKRNSMQDLLYTITEKIEEFSN